MRYIIETVAKLFIGVIARDKVPKQSFDFHRLSDCFASLAMTFKDFFNGFIIIIFGCLLFLGCARVDESGPVTTDDEVVPDQVIWNGKIEITDNGRLQSIVQAGYIQSFQKKKLTLLDSGVTVDFFDKRGRHTSVLTSERARVEEKSDIFLAQGNVVVVSDSGAVLRTERLYWDKKKRRVHSDTLVILTTDLDSLRGYDFEADENLNSWSLKKPTGRTFRRRQ